MISRATSPAPTFEVVCSCGRSVRGERQQRSQVVPCPGCGRALFVLPRSPWSAPNGAGRLAQAGAGHSRWGLWRWPLLSGLASAALIVAGFLIAMPHLAREKGGSAGEPTGAGEVLARMVAGRKALGEGKFHLALKELDAAVALRDRSPGELTPEQHRDLNQLQRQADLLDRRSPLNLAEILKRAAAARDLEDWKGHFDKTYRGKTILFDRIVGRPTGQPALLGEALMVHDEKARVALEDLTLLRYLPLDPPVRLLFGARLASAAREAGGEWVVRFQPDSAVLLTDPGTAQHVAAAPGLDEVLARQARWLRALSGSKPAPRD